MSRSIGPTRVVRSVAVVCLGASAGLVVVGCSGIEVNPGARTIWEALGPPTPEVAAQWALDRNDANKRFQGTILLANAPWGGADPYIRMYEDYIDDPDANVRAAATRALGNHGRPEHVTLILKNLRDPEPRVRTEVVHALQRVHNPIAVDPLLETLDPSIEEVVDIRAGAADALGQYASDAVVQKLIEALDDRHLRINRNARRSLRTLTGQDLGFDRVAWQSWYRDQLDARVDPFAARSAYIYPVFKRNRQLLEYLPFVPPPPNEEAATPVGFPKDLRAG